MTSLKDIILPNTIQICFETLYRLYTLGSVGCCRLGGLILLKWVIPRLHYYFGFFILQLTVHKGECPVLVVMGED